MDTKTPLDEAIELIGIQAVAKAVGRRYQAVMKWRDSNRLPRSEHTGETSYAQAIETATGGQVKAGALLAWSSAGWKAAA
jgi:hypothetical protein